MVLLITSFLTKLCKLLIFCTFARYHTVDVSVAVATPAGLITPIVKNADGKVSYSIKITTFGRMAKFGQDRNRCSEIEYATIP